MPRDVNGNYTLPSGNPVVTGTVIQSSWANPTMTDVANVLSASLDRSGNGSMLAPFKAFLGSVAAPGIVFDPGTGFYRSAVNNLDFAINGVNALNISANRNFTIAAPVSGVALSVAGGITVTGAAFLSRGIADNSPITALTLSATGNATIAAPSSGLGLTVAGGGVSVTGTSALIGAVTVTGTQTVSAAFQVTGSVATGLVGAGAELGYNGTTGYVQAYNRTGLAYIPMIVNGSSVSLQINGVGSTSFAISTNATYATLTNNSSGFSAAFGGVSGFQVNNAAASAQSVLDFAVNGTLAARIRSDYAGNLTYVATTTNHSFYTGGDSGVGTVRAQINSNNSTSLQCTDDGGTLQTVGYRDVPQNYQTGATYTVVIADRGKHIYAVTGSAKTHTIPLNATLPFTVGTVITWVNDGSGSNLTISAPGVSLAVGGSLVFTSSRVIPPVGVAAFLKIGTDSWIATGNVS